MTVNVFPNGNFETGNISPGENNSSGGGDATVQSLWPVYAGTYDLHLTCGSYSDVWPLSDRHGVDTIPVTLNNSFESLTFYCYRTAPFWENWLKTHFKVTMLHSSGVSTVVYQWTPTSAGEVVDWTQITITKADCEGAGVDIDTVTAIKFETYLEGIS